MNLLRKILINWINSTYIQLDQNRKTDFVKIRTVGSREKIKTISNALEKETGVKASIFPVTTYVLQIKKQADVKTIMNYIGKDYKGGKPVKENIKLQDKKEMSCM